MTAFITGQQFVDGNFDNQCSCGYTPKAEDACWQIVPAEGGKNVALVCYCPHCGARIGSLETVGVAS